MPRKAMTAETITLVQTNYERIRISIIGTGPLIQNRFPDSIRKAFRDKKTGAAEALSVGKKKLRPTQDPQTEADDRTHWTEDGKPAFPYFALNKCLVATGMRNGIADSIQLRAAMRVVNPSGVSEMLPLRDSHGKGSAKYTRREDIVRLANGAPDLCWRNEFKDWSLTFDVKFNAKKITAPQIINLVRIAGEETGLGAWRPENKNGWAGTFEVHPDVKSVNVDGTTGKTKRLRKAA